MPDVNNIMVPPEKFPSVHDHYVRICVCAAPFTSPPIRWGVFLAFDAENPSWETFHASLLSRDLSCVGALSSH
jgi:hypothetical protein